MFRFAHPEYLNALYLMPILALALFFLINKRKKMLEKFANKKLHSVLLPDFSVWKIYFKSVLIILSLTLLILAAANPQIGTKLQEVKQTGIDVFICLDVSKSMLAQDIKPNRLERAKFQIANIINKLKGDRIGLIVFSGQAYVQFPLTTDYSAANLFLSAVDVNTVPQPGTAIASAIDMAVSSFDFKTPTEKAIILITDGEENQGDPVKSVSDAVEKNIKVYTIGLGSPDGVPIPIQNSNGEVIGFKKDSNGQPVLTKLNEQILKEIANKGNGKYYRASNYEDQLDLIYKDLASLNKTEFGMKKVTDYEDRYYYLLIPALVLLMLEFFISESKSPLFVKMYKLLGLEKS